jgi:D-serine deaminase-like pyridoxal phosphate-dependent protein
MHGHAMLSSGIAESSRVRQACVRAYEAASGLRADLRAALQSRVGTCVRLCAADSAAPTPLPPPSDRLSRGWEIQENGTKLDGIPE